MAEPLRFVPRAETWLWDMLAPGSDVPVPWFLRRFDFLAGKLTDKKYRRDAAIVPAAGKNSLLASVEIDGGRDLKYVIVYAKKIVASWQPGIVETVTYRRDVAGTDLVYDLTGEFLQGKARPFECDLRKLPLRVYAVLPFQIERVDVSMAQKWEVQATPGLRNDAYYVSPAVCVRCLDASGAPIQGRLPVAVEFVEPGRKPTGEYFTYLDEDGRVYITQIGLPIPAGEWMLYVRTPWAGEELMLPFEVVRATEISKEPAPLTSRGLSSRHAPKPVVPEDPDPFKRLVPQPLPPPRPGAAPDP